MASMPIEITRLSSNTGRQVTPLFMVFQMPPPAVATKSVFDGPGMPTMSDERPSKFAGPRLRHRMPAIGRGVDRLCVDGGGAKHERRASQCGEKSVALHGLVRRWGKALLMRG